MATARMVSLTWEDVRQGGTHGHMRTVGRGQAHAQLKALRAQCSGELNDDNILLVEVEHLDLTDSHRDFWREYLMHRQSRAQRVIGVGVVSFGLRFFLDEYDANTKQARCDFVVERADGSFVRLHPETRKESIELEGPTLQGPWTSMDGRPRIERKWPVPPPQTSPLGGGAAMPAAPMLALGAPPGGGAAMAAGGAPFAPMAAPMATPAPVAPGGGAAVLAAPIAIAALQAPFNPFAANPHHMPPGLWHAADDAAGAAAAAGGAAVPTDMSADEFQRRLDDIDKWDHRRWAWKDAEDITGTFQWWRVPHMVDTTHMVELMWFKGWEKYGIVAHYRWGHRQQAWQRAFVLDNDGDIVFKDRAL